MRTKFSALVFALALTGCFGSPTPETSVMVPTQQSSRSEVLRETPNVSYQGTLEPAGISIYQQGSHQLALGDGRFLLMESAKIDLSIFENKHVEVYGALRPTVEAGGIIMRVERVTDLSPSTPSSSSEESSVETLSSSTESAPLASSIASVISTRSIPSSTVVAPSSSAPASQAPVSDPAMETRITTMAKQDFAAALWTQKYCTAHVSFCAPVHKNWWFKSFGATTSTLWHVEIAPEEIFTLGQGPISINVLPGESSAHATVNVRDGQAIAERDWTDNRHFVISGDARLEAPIRYIMENITPYAAQ